MVVKNGHLVARRQLRGQPNLVVKIEATLMQRLRQVGIVRGLEWVYGVKIDSGAAVVRAITLRVVEPQTVLQDRAAEPGALIHELVESRRRRQPLRLQVRVVIAPRHVTVGAIGKEGSVERVAALPRNYVHPDAATGRLRGIRICFE